MPFGVRSISLLTSKIPKSGSMTNSSRVMLLNYLQKIPIIRNHGNHGETCFKRINCGEEPPVLDLFILPP